MASIGSILRAATAALVLLAALTAAGCASRPPLPLDPGWSQVPDAEPAAMRYEVQDVEVRATKLGDDTTGEPVEIAGTILAHGSGAYTAEFLPPPDGVGAVTVVVTDSGGSPGVVPVGAPAGRRATRVTAEPGVRFPLGRGAAGSPASLSFRLLPPDLFDAVESGPGPRLRACTILLRGEGFQLTIPFRFDVAGVEGPDATTVALLLLVLAGVIVFASTGDFFFIGW